MWNDMANKEDGEKREKELEKKYWFDMIAKGCVVKRFDCTYSSALEILACTPRLVEGTLLTSEMVNEGKPLKATAAGYELANDIANTIKKQKAKNRALRKSSKKATNDKERSYLEGERVENDENIRNANKRLLLVKTTLFDRLFMSKPEASLVPRVGMLPQD
ncbi:hypothetical protein FRC18_001078 [Serendipita sp. 400]|nr:hypothetical protein FRC18_001078 [Serendipita sp. 400]